MHTEDLILHKGSQGNVVKEVGKFLPYLFRAKLLITLFIEPINLRDSARLVIAPGQSDPIGVPDLEGKQQTYSFDRIVTTIDIVSQEQVVRVGRLPSNGEELNQIVQLPMHIATDSHRGLDKLSIGLIGEDLLGLLYYDLDLFLGDGFE